MEQLKRFVDIHVPITTCTLRCHYCYITCHRLFEGKPTLLRYSPSHVRQCLSKERLGGTCLINLCGGGETLLQPQLPLYIKELLLEGHYVMVVTNATVSSAIDELCLLPAELQTRLFYKFSYHYLQLKERNLLSRFFDNVEKCRKVGASFTVEITPNDELMPFADEAVYLCESRLGAKPHFTIGRDERIDGVLPILTNLSKDEYFKFWGKYQSDLFSFKYEIFEQKRSEFCYAGDWSFYLNLGTGQMEQCYKSIFYQNIFEDPTTPIRFCAIGKHCQEQHCYNGHAYLAIGDIPDLETPTYGVLRNRICQNGSNWLRPEMKAFMSQKLHNANACYNCWQKILVEIPYIKKKIKRILK